MSSSTEVMSHEETRRYKWNQIPWATVEKNVFKLQKRIYQATRREETVKVHKLQRLLIKSKCAKLLAVRRVTQDNSGKRTMRANSKGQSTPERPSKRHDDRRRDERDADADEEDDDEDGAVA